MLQQKLFSKILAQYNSQADALKVITTLLDLDKSNAYRRVTGKIALKPNEIVTLVKHYNLSLDELTNTAQNRYLFQHSLTNPTGSFVDFLKTTNAFIGHLTTVPDLLVRYYGNEISYVYFGKFPALTYFKLTQWKRLRWNINNPVVFNFDEITTEISDLIQENGRLYSQLNTIEIWDKTGIDLLLQQIRYSYNIGLLLPKDAKYLLNNVFDVLDELEKKTYYGSKDLVGLIPNHEGYLSQTPTMGYFYIATSPTVSGMNYIQTSIDAPNISISHSPKLVQQMLQHFNNAKNQAQKITGAGELPRRRLFTHYRNQVRRLEKEIR